MNRIQKLAINCGLVFFGIFVACCVAEVALRILNIGSSKEEPPQYYFQKTDYGYDITPDFTPHPMLIDGCYKCNVWSNEIGCFDYSIKHFQGNKNTILLLGDSFTWGYTDFNDKWGTLIEKLCSFPVLTCGVGGFGIKQEYMKGRKILDDFNIGTIIVGYYVGNDLEDDYHCPRITVLEGCLVSKVVLSDIERGKKETIISDNPSHIDKIKALLWYNSRIYRVIVPKIKYILYQIGLDKLFYRIGLLRHGTRASNNIGLAFYNYDWIKDAWEDHFRNLLAFKQLSYTLNKNLLFIVIPTKEQVYTKIFECKDIYAKDKIDINRPNKILYKFFKDNKITYLDLLPLFRYYAREIDSCFLDPAMDLYWKYDGHWNVRGNHLAGLLVSKYLLKHNIITVPDKQEKIAKIDKQLMEEFGKLPPENLL